MKIFLSFRYTGETPENLKLFFSPVVELLASRNHDHIFLLEKIPLWQAAGQSVQQMLQQGMQELASADSVLVIIRSQDRSEGMLMEVGYALAKGKTILLAVAEGVNTYIRDVAHKTIKFRDQSDLLAKLPDLLDN